MNDKALMIFVVLVLVLAVFLFAGGIYSTVVEQQCLRNGYPEALTTIDLHGYCISWIDATKVVVPVGEVR